MNGCPLVSIIIANWNGRDWLEQCLPTLAAQTFADFEIIIVDNGSSDDSVGWLHTNWPLCQVLAQPKNLGFAAANNLGIQQAQGEYIVTLNNDTRVAPGWLEALVTAVNAPDIGMVASQICLWQQPDCLDSAGIEVDKAGIAWHRGWQQPIATASTACDVFGPSAAAALYRQEMLRETGCFDETYFAYYEDVDLAWRAQRAGWRCRYAPDARIWHWHSATAGKSSAFKVRLLGRNKLWTIAKNYEPPSLYRYALLILLYELLAVSYQTIQNRNLAAAKGRWDALKSIRRIKKQTIPAKQPVQLSPLTPPWQLHRRA